MINFKGYITKLQNLPEVQKKIILFTIVIILGLIMGYFWIRGAINSFNKIGESMGQIELPEIQMPEVPDILQTTTPSNQDIINK